MKLYLLIFGMMFFGELLIADVKTADIFQNSMVLQRDTQVPVWGTAESGEKVSVEFAGQRIEAVTGNDGKWRIELAPLKLNTQDSDMLISGNNKITLKNILVGDVWLSAGQSNMEFKLKSARNANAELAAAEYPKIRFFETERNYNRTPLDSIDGKWTITAPDSCTNFSAVAYFFAREIFKETGVPIGILDLSKGCTRAQAWMSLETLKMRPDIYARLIEEFENEDYRKGRFKDPGFSDQVKDWANPGLDVSGWKDINTPAHIEGRKIVDYIDNVFGNVDGVFWYRKTFDVPASLTGKDLTLHLGAVDDLDTTYFNGEQIGSTGIEVPNYWAFKRVYTIPARLVKAGNNTLAVRVVDEHYAGGLSGPDLYITSDNGQKVNLKGPWKVKDEIIIKPLPLGSTGSVEHMPVYYYNAMIHPVVPFAIKGVIWYQGCCNTGDKAGFYTELMKDLIHSWRAEWRQGDFPFYFVQLANFMRREKEPSQKNNGYPGIRDEQRRTLNIKNTGMAVAIDVGEADDIHPRNKQDVGYRLALPALAHDYGKKIVTQGPLYKSMTIEGNKIRIKFDSSVGLKAKGDQPRGFSICGKEKTFIWADAVIDGEDVLVSAESVKEPVAVRYAWANNPACNLYNAAELPASPFRTDDF